MIRRFYEYARWCWKSSSDPVHTAVACAFYEHLPTTPAMRRNLPRRIGRAEFAELSDVFRYHLSSDEAAVFDREFLEGKQRLFDAQP